MDRTRICHIYFAKAESRVLLLDQSVGMYMYQLNPTGCRAGLDKSPAGGNSPGRSDKIRPHTAIMQLVHYVNR